MAGGLTELPVIAVSLPGTPPSRASYILPCGTRKWPWDLLCSVKCGEVPLLDRRFTSQCVVLHVFLSPAMGPAMYQMDAACQPGSWNEDELGVGVAEGCS